MSRRPGAIGVAITALAVVAASLCMASGAAAERYVAMGDSYSSGTGTNDYYEPNCQRSDFAYAGLIKGDIGGSFRMVACSGAKTAEVLTATQQGNPPQVNLLGAETEYVSISIGGNDAGFTDTLVACGQPEIWPLNPDCDGKIAASQNTIQNVLPARFDQVLTRIRQKSPNARITLVGYPRLFPANGNDCSVATFFSASEMTRLNQMADLLADVERSRARANGATYVDARGAFLGHAWCEDEWINGLSNPTSNSFHPNKSGHVGYAGIVRSAMLAAPAASSPVRPSGRIAFSASSGNGSSVTVINSNGLHRTDLTDASSRNLDPVFSPDGDRIAFASDRAGAGLDVYTMRIDGTDLRRLTTATGDDREPTWSPNGEFIAFRSERTGTAAIFRMRADGTGQTNLTSATPASGSPAWSPDGSEIAFQRGGEVYKMNADGQGQTNLTGNGSSIDDAKPAYSPDGSRIAFHSNRDGNYEIYTMSPTGGSVTRRTAEASADRDPAWSPDGAQIVFRSNREGTDRIFTMPSTSGAAVRRTQTAATDARPSWQGDGTPPVTSITSGPAAVTNQDAPTVEFTSDEAGSTFECRYGNAQFQPCASPFASPVLADGPHRFQVRAIDPSGNVDPDPESREFTVDTRAKVTTIVSGPSGPAPEPAPTFVFASEVAGVGFECRLLPGGDWEGCVSPFVAPGLADGSYRFEVRGIDQAGNVEDPAQFREFTVDTRPPESSITHGPGALSNDPEPSFEFEADETGAGLQCSLVGSQDESWKECSSPLAPGGLGDGQFKLRVRAVDLAGNVEPIPSEWAFAIDTVAPVSSIDSGPGERIESPETEIGFTADDPAARFECRLDSLDDGDWSACESPVRLTGLTHGLHGFQVRAADAAGNVEASPRTVEFGVDILRPQVVVDSGPGDPDGSRRPSIAFHSIDPGADFECRLDRPDASGEWVQCVSPFVPSADLGEGRHEFRVRAADVFGQVEQSEAVDWLVDAVAPGTTIVEGPRDSVASASAEFEFRADEEQQVFECSLDGAPWASCGAGANFADLSEGPHQLRVRAEGPLSGAGPVISRNWTVDLTPPAPAFTYAPAAATNARSAEFGFAAGEPATFECRLDSGSFASCGSPHSVYQLAEGEHRLDVRATDSAGNTGTASHSWTVVVGPPPLELTVRPGRYSPSPTADFAFSSGRELAAAVCRIDEGQWESCDSPVTFGDLRDGPHDFAVKVTDLAGNTATAGYGWDVDTVAPSVTIESGPADQTFASGVEMGFVSSELHSEFRCSLDRAPFVACTSPWSSGTLEPGPHVLAVVATDRAGNTGPAAERTWTRLEPETPPVPRVPVVTPRNSVRLGSAGKARVATIRCGDRDCSVTGTRRVEVRVRGRKRLLRVILPSRLTAGRTGAVTVRADRAVRRALVGRAVKPRIVIAVSSGGDTIRRAFRVKLRG